MNAPPHDQFDEVKALTVVSGAVTCPTVYALRTFVRHLETLTWSVSTITFDSLILGVVVWYRITDSLAISSLQNLFINNPLKADLSAVYRLDWGKIVLRRRRCG